MNLTTIKRLFFKVLIGCLIAAAALAVVTILLGRFSSVSEKALFTILIIALHALVGISFIENNEKQQTFESLQFFTNFTFMIIILSFITAVCGTWGLITATVVIKAYETFFILLFAVLHAEVLAKTRGKQINIDKVVTANYIFMFIVVVMILPIIFASDASSFPGVYYRLLAAAGIVDATLTLIAVILHNLYVQKHPKIVDPVFGIQPLSGQPTQYVQVPGQPGQYVPAPQAAPPKKRMNAFVLILLVFIGFQILTSVIVAIVGTLHR